MLVLILTLGLVSTLVSIFIKGNAVIILEPYFMFSLSYTKLAVYITAVLVLLSLLWKFINFFFFKPVRWYDSYKKKKENVSIEGSIEAYARYLGGANDAENEYVSNSKILEDNGLYWILALNFSNRSKIYKQAIDELKKYKIGGFFELYYKVTDLVKQDQYDNAVLALESAPQYAHKTQWFWSQSINCYIAQGNVEKAKNAVKHYRNFNNKISANNLEATIYQMEAKTVKDVKSKISLLEKAYSLSSKDMGIIYDYAVSLYNTDQDERAVRTILNSWHIVNSIELGILLEKILSKLKTDSEKFQIFKDLLDKNPQDFVSKLLLARSALQANMWFIARDTLMNLAKTKPTLAFPLLAELELKEKQDKDSAYKWLSKLAEYIKLEQ